MAAALPLKSTRATSPQLHRLLNKVVRQMKDFAQEAFKIIAKNGTDNNILVTCLYDKKVMFLTIIKGIL